jgi:tetratricopeptide (TPR) repeat protein
VMLKLGLTLTESDRALLRRPASKNQDALNEYYRARRLLDVVDESSQTKAIEHFEAALRHDAEFALAHAGLADAHVNLGFIYREPLVSLPRARASINAALKIDATLPEAKITDGILKYFLEWDWPGAKKSLDEALRLDVSAVEANACYLHMQDVYGLGAEALGTVQRAVALHPSSLAIQAELGCAAYYAGLFDQAEAYSRESLRNEPDNPVVHWLLARTLAQKGRYDEALALLQAGKSKPGGEWCALDGDLAYVHARMGETDRARQIIAALEARERAEYIEPYVYAVIHAGLGDADKMFECLHQACDKRSIFISSLPTEPKFAPYRSDPRYQRILMRMKLPVGGNWPPPPHSRPEGTTTKSGKAR